MECMDRKVPAATELHCSWYLNFLKNTLSMLKKIWKQICEYVHIFLRTGRNLEKKYFVFWEIQKREISDKNGIFFLLYTVRNLFFFYSPKQNEICTETCNGYSECVYASWEIISHFFETSKIRIWKSQI